MGPLACLTRSRKASLYLPRCLRLGGPQSCLSTSRPPSRGWLSAEILACSDGGALPDAVRAQGRQGLPQAVSSDEWNMLLTRFHVRCLHRCFLAMAFDVQLPDHCCVSMMKAFRGCSR
jgi:hypothetical protein